MTSIGRWQSPQPHNLHVPQVDLEPPPRMSTMDAELLVGLLKGHLVRMLRVAPALQMLDFTTFAIQVQHDRPPDLP